MLITNIQRFSLHDGPGIRTTVFLKGCSLRCPWCANPENLNPKQEKFMKDGKEGIYGMEYSVEEVFSEVMRDKVFYEDGGGVTFSGGEALLYMKELVPLIKMLKKEGIGTAVETCLVASDENVRLAIEYIDIFYVDMKIMNTAGFKEILRGDFNVYLKNLDILYESGKIFTVRIPVIGGYTDGEENRKCIIGALEKYKDHISRVEVIKEHSLGVSKYKSLGSFVPDYRGVSDDLMMQYKKEIEEAVNIQTEICRI